MGNKQSGGGGRVVPVANPPSGFFRKLFAKTRLDTNGLAQTCPPPVSIPPDPLFSPLYKLASFQRKYECLGGTAGLKSALLYKELKQQQKWRNYKLKRETISDKENYKNIKK